MNNSDIRRNKDGSWKLVKALKRTPVKKVGRRGKRLRNADSATKKRLVSERGLVCEMAGVSECLGDVEVHHIRTKGAHPELRQSDENLRLLCHRHHSEQHIGEWKS